MAYKKGTRIGSFILEEVLSEHGGMGDVYKATIVDEKYPNRHNKTVALKLAHVGKQDSDIYESLLIKETDLLHDLRHPGIVRLYPITQFSKILYFARAIELASPVDPLIDAPLYFVMELLSKESLENTISDKRYTLDWRIELIYQLATTIDYLHLRQIAHRDLKPTNVLFRAAPHPHQLPVPVLIDFGLAEKRRLRPQITASTLAYTAPERVKRIIQADQAVTETHLDHFASDIWGLGMIAYELLARKYPFNHLTNQTALAYQLVNEAPNPIPEAVPPKIQALILDMLAKEPQQRPLIEAVVSRLETQIEVIAPRL